MADWQRHVVTTRRVEYTLPTPADRGADWDELTDMVGRAVTESGDDKAVRVYARRGPDGDAVVAAFQTAEATATGVASPTGVATLTGVATPTDLRETASPPAAPAQREADLREIATTAVSLLDKTRGQETQTPMNEMDAAWLRATADKDIAVAVPARYLLRLALALDAAGMAGWWTP